MVAAIFQFLLNKLNFCSGNYSRAETICGNISKTNWKFKFWVTYGEVCCDVGYPIKVAKKLWNPLIFFCLMNVTKECIVRDEKGGFLWTLFISRILQNSQDIVHKGAFCQFPGFITAIVVNPPERKLAKCTSVQCIAVRKSIEKCSNQRF